MEKWPEERIAAYKDYVRIMKRYVDYENRITEHQKGLRSMIEAVCSVREKRRETLTELYKQGWLLDDDRWVEVNKIKEQLAKANC